MISLKQSPIITENIFWEEKFLFFVGSISPFGPKEKIHFLACWVRQNSNNISLSQRQDDVVYFKCLNISQIEHESKRRKGFRKCGLFYFK